MGRSETIQRVRDRLPSGAVRLATVTVELSGRATASWRVLPDFLVIGCKKGGTTSLMNWLVEHPAVARMYPSVRRRKSPHYFDINYWRGPQWYRSHFPTRRTLDRTARRSGRQPLVGEASPYYLFHPAVPQRVSETLPDVRLIALLREPVSRAYSHYWDRVATGHEDLPSFEAAIDAEAERLSGVTGEALREPTAYSYDHDHHTYLARGRYVEQLPEWFGRCDPERLLVLPAEAIFTQPQKTFEAVLGFLGLPPADVPLRTWNKRASYPPIRPETKARLSDYYRPYNRALFDLLGEEFDWA